jgi:hypothetical protein
VYQFTDQAVATVVGDLAHIVGWVAAFACDHFLITNKVTGVKERKAYMKVQLVSGEAIPITVQLYGGIALEWHAFVAARKDILAARPCIVMHYVQHCQETFLDPDTKREVRRETVWKATSATTFACMDAASVPDADLGEFPAWAANPFCATSN